MTTNGTHDSTSGIRVKDGTEGEPWFDDARVVDREWVEYSVTTSSGQQVRYRIPRRTLFTAIDQ
ncbi:MAG TPA: hypothetical protein VHV74_01045 [Pseudonocardiaceae bacterium]|nr:hypothetical protein [Pseudonocardiaceae bacterium]